MKLLPTVIVVGLKLVFGFAVGMALYWSFPWLKQLSTEVLVALAGGILAAYKFPVYAEHKNDNVESITEELLNALKNGD